MSRHGYSDDGWDDESAQWASIRFQGALKSALRGQRGQAFLRRMIAALDALPEQRLIAGNVVEKESGACCALGAVYRHEGIEPPELSESDLLYPEEIDEEWLTSFHSKSLNMAGALAREVQYQNDECSMWGLRGEKLTLEGQEERRWKAMRAWAAKHLNTEAPQS